MRPPEQLLYDSEASLRLVDHAIEELSSSGATLDREAKGFLEHVMKQPGGFAELSRTLLRAYAETVGIVVRLRESCGMIDNQGVDKLQQMHGSLNEVSSATESATTDILDGLGRAVQLVEELDADSADETARKLRIAQLKDELSGVMNHLQFQDITAQQLGHIAGLLTEMRRRITQIVTIFSPPMVSFAKDEPAVPSHYDPNATSALTSAPDRQAVADEIFKQRKTA